VSAEADNETGGEAGTEATTEASTERNSTRGSGNGTDVGATARTPPPVRGRVLAAVLVISAAAMLGAATLGWSGIPILIGFLAAGCALLVRWSR
jgi:hypothetical protein